MAAYSIIAVHVGSRAAPIVHEHIESVRLGTGTTLSRAQVIAMIHVGDTFTTAANPPGRVYEHNCPHCGSGDYITTHPDSTPTNNLLRLPRF